VELAAMVAGQPRHGGRRGGSSAGHQVSERLTLAAVAVLGDATRLKQVLTNLLSNAVKYNQPDGRVGISSRWRRADGWIEIEVADTGLGMTDPQLARCSSPTTAWAANPAASKARASAWSSAAA
jgi:signal transduction histidine kinase